MKKTQLLNLKNYAIARRSVKEKKKQERVRYQLVTATEPLMVGAVPILYFRQMLRKSYESNNRSKSVEMLNYFRLLLVTGHF